MLSLKFIAMSVHGINGMASVCVKKYMLHTYFIIFCIFSLLVS